MFEVPALLVASHDHPVFSEKPKLTQKALSQYAFLTVRGADPRLQTGTGFLESGSTIRLNDFHSKKEAILSGVGIGWLPEYLIENELKRGKLKVISWKGPSTHTFHPHLYYKSNLHLGKAALEFIQVFRKDKISIG